MRALLLVALVLLLAGCSGDVAAPEATASSTTTSSSGFDQALHDELLAMLERDQSRRTGGPDAEGDVARTARLKDGEDAAWAVAQHSDQDPAFQGEALELLRAAVDAGQASPGNLAYLTDRVAVGAGEPQPYGTQVGCGPDGPEPATPIADEGAVDGRRAEVGLPPLADYLAEMAAICAGD
jgi:hypothetical protein